MSKEALCIGAGIAVGAALCYGGYKLHTFYHNQNREKDNTTDDFDKRLKSKEEVARKLNDLLSNQSYVELLTSKELTAWFKENRSQFREKVKMIIVTPTEQNMKGIGYMDSGDIDVDTNIVQLFYSDEEGKVLKVRLINYTNIDSNLQAHLIEQNGMIVVTD